jgi:hypothetical protein
MKTIAFLFIVIWLCRISHSQDASSRTVQSETILEAGEPNLFTDEEIADLFFIKPDITLQRALKLWVSASGRPGDPEPAYTASRRPI